MSLPFDLRDSHTGERVSRIQVSHLVNRGALVLATMCAVPVEDGYRWVQQLTRAGVERAVRDALYAHGVVDLEPHAETIEDYYSHIRQAVEGRIDQLFPEVAP